MRQLNYSRSLLLTFSHKLEELDLQEAADLVTTCRSPASDEKALQCHTGLGYFHAQHAGDLSKFNPSDCQDLGNHTPNTGRLTSLPIGVADLCSNILSLRQSVTQKHATGAAIA